MSRPNTAHVVTTSSTGGDRHSAHCDTCGWWGYSFRLNGDAWDEAGRHRCPSMTPPNEVKRESPREVWVIVDEDATPIDAYEDERVAQERTDYHNRRAFGDGFPAEYTHHRYVLAPEDGEMSLIGEMAAAHITDMRARIDELSAELSRLLTALGITKPEEKP